jgi:hypothetical protein
MMIEIYGLLGIIIISIILLYYYNKCEEGFTTADPAFRLQGCPSGYNSFYDTDGSTMCCDGEIIANSCNGNKQCMLNGTSGSIPNCTAFVMEDYKHKGEQCPPSMSSYYEYMINKKIVKGCTAGPLNNTMDGPANTSQPKCTIYSALDTNIQSVDSCYNQKELDNFPCFGKDCVKSLTQTKEKTPVLVTITFTDSTGIQRTAHTRASMQRFLNATKPNWKDSGMDLSKNIAIAEVAKAFYVDRTLSQEDVQN